MRTALESEVLESVRHGATDNGTADIVKCRMEFSLQSGASVGTVPPVFHEVAKTLTDVVRNLSPRVNTSRLAELREYFRQPECSQIDYDHYAVEFACSYLLQNYWKAVLTFLESPPRLAQSILDVGVGSGATILAYLAYLDSYVEHTVEVDALLLDKSEIQLQLALEVVGRVSHIFKNVRVLYRAVHQDVIGASVDSAPELVLLGHVLTENRPSVPGILLRLCSILRADGRLYAIERTTDTVWDDITRSIRDIAYPSTMRLTRPKDDVIRQEDSPPAAHFDSLVTKFAVIRAPENKLFVSLVHKYFRAWQEQRVDLLDEVFAEDATYHEKLNEQTMIGIEAIRSYWRTKVLPQRMIQIQLTRFAYSIDQAFIEWRAEFTGASNLRSRLRGIVVLDIDARLQRVVALRECFSTNAEQA